MITSYEVGAIFMIEDRASGILGEMAEQFTRLDELAMAFNRTLAGIGEGAFANLTGEIARVGEAMTSLTDESKVLSETLVTGFDAIKAATGEAVAGVDAMTAALERAASAATRLRDADMGIGGGRGSGPGGPGGAGPRRRTAEESGYGPPTLEEFLRPFGVNDDWANGHEENRRRNAAYDAAHREATYENNRRDSETRAREGFGFYGPGTLDDENLNPRNRSYAAEEAARVRAARAAGDVNFEEEGGRGGGGGGGGGGRSGGGGGPHVGGVLSGMAPLVEGMGVFEAEKAAMEEDLATRQALMGMNITDDMPEFKEAFDRLHRLYYTATRGTKFSEAEAAKASREAAPVLAIPGMEGVEAMEKTYPIALRAGELSELRHKGSIGAEAVAAEEFAHLEQNYDPEHLTKSIDLVNAIAMRTDTSIGRQLSIAKYALPTAMMAGVDPDQAMAEVGAAELRMGATTTAGTGYSRFLLGALHTGGGINAQLPEHLRSEAHRAEREFEHAFKLDPRAMEDAHHAKEKPHDAALRALGITDESGKLLDVTAEGGLDVQRIKEQIGQYAQTHDRQHTLNTIQDAFGTYGGRYAAAYMDPEMLARERQQVAGFRGAPSVEKEQEGLSHSPMQQWEQMIANFSNIGNTLATTTLTGLNNTLGTVNTSLLAFNDFLKAHQGIAQGLGYTALAGGTAGALGLAGWLGMRAWSGLSGIGRGIGGLLGGGGAGAAAEEGLSMSFAEEGLGAAAAGGGGMLAGLGGFAPIFAGWLGGEQLGEQAGAWARQKVFGSRPNPAASNSVMQYFVGQGYSPGAAAGIAGNLYQESGFDPKANNGSHVGIAQWDQKRRMAIEQHFGKAISQMNLQEQLSAVQWELTQGGYGDIGAALHGTNDPVLSASIFDRGYEKPGHYDIEDPKRGTLALSSLQSYRPGPSPAAGAAAARGDAPLSSGSSIIINLTNTMNGVADEATYHNLLTKLTDALKGALSHSTSAAQGSDVSPYVYGGP